jgi:uncharacterized membrane protein
MAVGFIGAIAADMVASIGNLVNPGSLLKLGLLGIIILIVSLIIERIQDYRKENEDDLSQY